MTDIKPGQIVQVINPLPDAERWRGALVEVNLVRAWGIVGQVWAPPLERGQPPGMYPVRFEMAEVMATGGEVVIPIER